MIATLTFHTFTKLPLQRQTFLKLLKAFYKQLGNLPTTENVTEYPTGGVVEI